jgi:hypothetical protein
MIDWECWCFGGVKVSMPTNRIPMWKRKVSWKTISSQPKESTREFVFLL